MATAGWPSAAAAFTTSSIRAAPSSIEYSVWRWQCTKLGGTWRDPLLLSTVFHMPGVENYTLVIRRTVAARPTASAGVQIRGGSVGPGMERHILATSGGF